MNGATKIDFFSMKMFTKMMRFLHHKYQSGQMGQHHPLCPHSIMQKLQLPGYLPTPPALKVGIIGTVCIFSAKQDTLFTSFTASLARLSCLYFVEDILNAIKIPME